MPEALPQRPHPDLRKVWFWRGLAFGLVAVPTLGWPLVLPLGIALHELGLGLVTAFLAAGAVWYLAGLAWLLVWARSAIASYAFAITESEVRIRRGVLFRSETVYPLGRLQSAQVQSGPLLRRYGLQSIRLRGEARPDAPSIWGEPQLVGLRNADAVAATLVERAKRLRG